MTELLLTPEEKDKIREGWLARRATTKAEPSTMCLAKHTHKGAYWQVMCSCSRDPGHPADYHEDASVPVRWPVEAALPVTAAPPVNREWLTARLTGLAVSASLESLTTAVALLENLPPRDIGPAALMAAQRAREDGTETPLRPCDPDAAALGRALALVAREVERAAAKHGRAFPGGWGASGRAEDKEARQRAQDVCDLAASEGRATYRHVEQEEAAEVYAEVPGTPEHRAELVQHGAVIVRGLLVAMGEAVQGG